MSRKTLLYITLAAIVVAAGFYVFYVYTNSGSDTQRGDTNTQEEGFIDYSPATEEDNSDINDRKLDNDTTEENSSAEKGKVAPVITFAEDNGEEIIVSAFVDADSGGVCTLKLTKGSHVITKTVDAVPQPNNYKCGERNFRVDDGEFSEPGQWTATVAFSSTTQEGISNEFSFEVSK